MKYQDVQHYINIFAADITKKSNKTRSTYLSIARKYLEQSNDFARHSMMGFINDIGYSDNGIRTAHYALKRLCKSLDIKFPLDKEDLPPVPDDDDLNSPTMPFEDATNLIAYWKQRPGEYLTSLVFISTMFGPRTIELTRIQVTDHSIIIEVGKRRSKVFREHPVEPVLKKYLTGYRPMSEQHIRNSFWRAVNQAGVPSVFHSNWHSIRRMLSTAFVDAGINKVMEKRFMRWTKDRRDMADVYFHKDFKDINDEIYKVHPILPLWR